MKRVGRWLKFVVCGILIFGFLPSAEARQAYRSAKDFTLEQFSSAGVTKVSLQKELEAGKPVLLVFWASWCPSCEEEAPLLNLWYAKYGAAGKLKLFAINVEENREAVAVFSKKYEVRYPILMDSDGRVTESYQVSGLPVAVLINKRGKIIYYGFSLPGNVDALLN